MLILVLMAVVILGGGGVFLLWYLNKPKGQSWTARVWQLAEGVRPPIRDEDGNILSGIKKRDMKPLTMDLLKKTDVAPGLTRYELIKLGKVTPAVNNDVVDTWDKKNRFVDVLLDGDSVTLLRKGYDARAGEILFDPLPYDRKMMIMVEMQSRKERLENKKGLLEKLALYITIGILVLGIVATSYFMGDMMIKVSEDQTKIAELYASKWPGSPDEIKQQTVKAEPPPMVDAG